MKTISALLFTFLISLHVFSAENLPPTLEQKNSTFDYDPDFVEYIKYMWESKPYEKSTLPKFKQITSFFNQLKITDEGILADEFLKSPDNNILISYYIYTKLKWNSFNSGEEKLSTDEVIANTTTNLADRNEMLAFYYMAIFSHILNNQSTIEPYEKDIDFKKLGLTNQESAILFLSAMRHLGFQISTYAYIKFPDNCYRAEIFLTKIPTFNGKHFFDFTLPEFDDFLIEVDKRYDKVSYKEKFIPHFENAKSSYQKCLDAKK